MNESLRIKTLCTHYTLNKYVNTDIRVPTQNRSKEINILPLPNHRGFVLGIERL